MEINFVIDRSDIPYLIDHVEKSYNNNVCINSMRPLDINISSDVWYINLIENVYFNVEFPQSFICQMSSSFISPIYLFFSTNNIQEGEVFFQDLSLRKVIWDDNTG